MDKMVQIDVGRTVMGVPAAFSKLGSPQNLRLRLLLLLFNRRVDGFTYCQGLSFVAAALLSHYCDPNEAGSGESAEPSESEQPAAGALEPEAELELQSVEQPAGAEEVGARVGASGGGPETAMFGLSDGGCYGAFYTMVNFYASEADDKVLLQLMGLHFDASQVIPPPPPSLIGNARRDAARHLPRHLPRRRPSAIAFVLRPSSWSRAAAVRLLVGAACRSLPSPRRSL